jgi:hypothetical protein
MPDGNFPGTWRVHLSMGRLNMYRLFLHAYNLFDIFTGDGVYIADDM